MRPDLAQRIAAGCVVVTPNRRLASHLQREFDLAQAASGRRAWPSAECLSLNAFLERTWAEATRLRAGATLLSGEQEIALWESIIAAAREARPLLNLPAAARAAREAWGLVQAFRLELPRRPGLDEDSAAFAGWSARYRAQLAARGLIDAALLPDAVAAIAKDARRPGMRRLVFYAFDELAPQSRSLLEALAAAGWEVEELRPPESQGSATRAAYPDAETEFRAVAAQAREILAAPPAARIGVVVPDLSARRAQVQRVFDDALEPGRVMGASRERPRPYNISLGRPLADYPLVHAALLVLTCARGEFPLAAAGGLVLSPFIGGGETEAAARALLDARLRRRGAISLSAAALVSEAKSKPRGLPGTPLLAARLERWTQAAQRARRLRQPPSAWSATFQSLLAALGWPGERSLDSEEFQTFDRWRETIATLSALDLVTGRITYDEALSRLRRLASDAQFQPESEAVPLQVLGVLEATGLEFDHLFVTGLTDEVLPASPRPNPFLPGAMQRKSGVPHASAEWEMRFARRALASWRAAAAHVRLSHPLQEGERELRASPLLAGISEAPAAAPRPRFRDAVFAARAIERLPDYAAPPLAAGTQVAGGTRFFKNQADCPFRAFAVHRLGAEALDAGHPGLDARERGTLAHWAAKALWGELATHARLDAMSEEDMAGAAQRAAAVAVGEMRGERPDAMTDAFSRLEQERLARLLAALLRKEKLRAPFEVAAREERRTVELGGVTVRLQVDRIDRLGDGGRVILDYKTGRPSSPAAWLGERPDEPQLPLYAVTDSGEVAAVAFVALNARETGFRGVARAEGVLPGVATVAQVTGERHPDWRSLAADWRAALEKLAAEFLSGAVPVAPKQYPRTCDHCDVHTLCRVRELLDRGPVTTGEEDE